MSTHITLTQNIYGLEEHLEAIAKDYPEYKVLNELWKTHKRDLCHRLIPNPSLFGTYSDHGPTHSASIVSAINRILGDQRVRQLEPTDTWMLLECIYRHDMGMYVPDDRIEEFIQTREYSKLLKSSKESEDEELRDAAERLYQHPFHSHEERAEMTNQKKATLIRKYMRDLNLVLSGYFRSKHASSSAANIEAEYCDNDVPQRIWNLIATICQGHTGNREEIIEKLPQREQGIGRDTVHPRFVQILLRLGDLLDLDNNRFNFYAMAQWTGKVSDESLAQILKHKAVKHLYISPTKIEVEADLNIFDESEDVPYEYMVTEDEAKYKEMCEELSKKWEDNTPRNVIDDLLIRQAGKLNVRLHLQNQDKEYDKQARLQNKACRICAHWFQMLEDELKFTAINWVAIAPSDLSGSIPKITQKIIKWQGSEMDYDTINLKYKISHKRAADIIQGTGLYGYAVKKRTTLEPTRPNHELVFIRELVQNAMDATKIQVYRYLREDRYGEAVVKFGNDISKWNPIQVLKRIGDFLKNLKVEIRIHYIVDDMHEGKNKDRDCLRIEIRDEGIGIDNKTLKNMSMIGDTRDEALAREIEQMPEWLRPNGSFGVGMQSVFGVVDKFKARSGSRTDHKLRDLFFESADNSGVLFAAERTSIKNKYRKYGTRVTVDINPAQFDILYSDIINYDKPEGRWKTPLSYDCDELFKILLEQIEQSMGCDIFPIRIRFYVNDIEIRRRRKTLDSVFAPFLPLSGLSNKESYNPDNIVHLSPIKALIKKTVRHREDESAVFNKENKVLTYYNPQKRVVLEMKLHEFLTPVLGVREPGENAFRQISVLYRGMYISDFGYMDKRQYPCWDIKAYLYFGEAEEIVSISRNNLIPEKENEIYQIITECADEALDELFVAELTDIVDSLGQGHVNALALSMMYHQVSSAYRAKSTYVDYAALYDEIKDRVNFAIPVINDSFDYYTEITFEQLTKKGLFEHWFIHRDDVYTCISYKDFPPRDRVRYAVQDIFSSYLYRRGLYPAIKELYACNAGRSLVYFHKFTPNKDAVPDDDYDIYECIIGDMVNTATELCSDNNTSDSAHSRWDFPILPAIPFFKKSDWLCIKESPYTVPPNLRRLGNFVVCPFDYYTVHRIATSENGLLDEIIEHTNRWWDKQKHESQILRELARIILKADKSDRDMPYKKLVSYVANQSIESNPKISLKQAQKKCEESYIDLAASLTLKISPDFLDIIEQRHKMAKL
ncbi:MAG: hypothetical protein FWF78_05795 [Defluviitaleaceae bacterium]|nr:hypothetical protein [Defluviitaleaceae bacterium]